LKKKMKKICCILFLGTLVQTQVNKFSKAVDLPKPINNFTEVALD